MNEDFVYNNIKYSLSIDEPKLVTEDTLFCYCKVTITSEKRRIMYSPELSCIIFQQSSIDDRSEEGIEYTKEIIMLDAKYNITKMNGLDELNGIKYNIGRRYNIDDSRHDNPVEWLYDTITVELEKKLNPSRVVEGFAMR